MSAVVESLAHAIERVRKISSHAGYKDKQTTTYAVVYECDQPRKTRGTDYVMNLQLVDGSMMSADNAHLQPVELIVFSPTPDIMPNALRGDIIELRHVVVQFWDPPNGGAQKPQLFAKLSAPHPFGYILYRFSPHITPATVQPACQQNIKHLDNEQKTANLGRLWLLAAGLVTPSAPETATPYLRRIKDLDGSEDPNSRPSCVDLRVQVLAVDRRNESEEVVMFVWDGTDARPQQASLVLLPSIWRDKELTVQQHKRRKMPLMPRPGVEVMHELPPIGSAMPVVIEKENLPPLLPAVGAWVKLKVVGLVAVQGQIQLVFGRSSRITLSQPLATFDGYYKARLDSNDTSEWPLTEARDTNVVTWCSRQDLKPVTLRQVQRHILQREPGPFRVVLRMTGYIPRDLAQWCKQLPSSAASDATAAPDANGSQQWEWEWAAHILLEDATGELRALLLGREATRLLGLPPTDLTVHADDVEQLRQRLNALSAVDQYGGTWMDVALTPVYQQPRPQRSQQVQSGSQPKLQQQHEQPATHLVTQPTQGPTDGQSGAAVSAEQIVRECLFILHDAVCPHMQTQEDRYLQQQQSQQQQQEILNQQQNLMPEPSHKRLRREGSSGANMSACAPSTTAEQQHLSQQPAAETKQRCGLQEALAFM